MKKWYKGERCFHANPEVMLKDLSCKNILGASGSHMGGERIRSVLKLEPT